MSICKEAEFPKESKCRRSTLSSLFKAGTLSSPQGAVRTAVSDIIAQSSTPDIVEELAEGLTSTIDQCTGQERLARTTVQCRSESSNKDIVEALGHGPNYTPYQAKGQVYQANNTIQRWSECAPELTPDLRTACRLRALQGRTLEMVTASLVPAFLGGYTRHISIFMSIHPAFTRAHRFLDQLLTR